MAAASRENQILTLLSVRGELSVGDLAAQLGVSEATVRRDLHDLELRGQLRRVHGGATLAGVALVEPQFQDKEGADLAAKQRIAQVALGLIDDGDQIYLDGGSTVLLLARLLPRRRHLTIVTNSLMAAAALMDTEHRLVLVGGEFRSRSRTLVGPLTARVLGEVHVRQAFMGTIGFTLADGMTTTDPNEAYTKSLVLARAQQVVLLAAPSKFGVTSFARCGSMGDVDVVISDGLDDAWRRDLEEHGIRVLQPAPPADPAPAPAPDTDPGEPSP